MLTVLFVHFKLVHFSVGIKCTCLVIIGAALSKETKQASNKNQQQPSYTSNNNIVNKNEANQGDSNIDQTNIGQTNTGLANTGQPNTGQGNTGQTNTSQANSVQANKINQGKGRRKRPDRERNENMGHNAGQGHNGGQGHTGHYQNPALHSQSSNIHNSGRRKAKEAHSSINELDDFGVVPTTTKVKISPREKDKNQRNSKSSKTHSL